MLTSKNSLNRIIKGLEKKKFENKEEIEKFIEAMEYDVLRIKDDSVDIIDLQESDDKVYTIRYINSGGSIKVTGVEEI